MKPAGEIGGLSLDSCPVRFDDRRADAMTQANTEELTFEQAFEQLDQIVRALEDGDVGLEQALAQYELGVGLLKRCYGRLQDAEQRIRVLIGLDGEGNSVSAPFEHAATAENSGAEPKRKREADPEVLF
jgi:exodeoxyribonuclease VII small subunit